MYVRPVLKGLLPPALVTSQSDTTAPSAVVGALLDVEAPDEFVNNLILSVRSLIPVEQLCTEVEKRNRLKLLNPFLEHLVSEGSQVRRCRCTLLRRCSLYPWPSEAMNLS